MSVDSIRNLGSAGMRFVSLAILSAAATFGITVGLHELSGIPERGAYAVALVTGLVVNFVGLRYFVYRGRHRRAAHQFTVFAATSFAFRGAEYLAFVILIMWIPYQWAILLIMGTSFVTKFFFYRYRVFAPLPDNA